MVVYGPPIQTLDLMAESADLTLDPNDDSGCYMRDVEKGAILASSQFSGVNAACVAASTTSDLSVFRWDGRVAAYIPVLLQMLVFGHPTRPPSKNMGTYAEARLPSQSEIYIFWCPAWHLVYYASNALEDE
ncbi:hypothetical protein CY34DRAFT_17596 [Suillus luteus UH-Slu-Lm8-n1]|uniref:Uncharacterized protein n=1 Tax=Suillus luteus UH-Slu-Lm8-n1 TaxID=930992 RepID=A0A0D0A8Z7_9AGAM|nr:hypothetical protein CY34DRAFT_17596 [Suillus luteus UH-Slu-Lm8-n1]